jgi:hypothetical protein
LSGVATSARAYGAATRVGQSGVRTHATHSVGVQRERERERERTHWLKNLPAKTT